MFGVDGGGSGGAAEVPFDARAITGLIPRLARLATDVSDAERVDQLRALEEVKAAAAAAQARVAVELDASQRAAQAAAGVPAAQRGRGVAGQIGLARRESPRRGALHLGVAMVLDAEMPHTRAALERGVISEWRAQLLVRETACLSVEHRREIDARLAGDPTVLEGWGDRRLVAEIQKLACELDAASVARRRARAEAERRVTLRPAPDTMAVLSGLVPVAQGVAMYAALRRAAESRVAGGDPRTRGQIMADTLVERVTGQATASDVPVEIQLVMSEAALLGEGEASAEPAHLAGFGPVPADLARRLAASAAEAEQAWLRRLYLAPDSGRLVGMDSTRRFFPAGLARFIRVRDQFCRTPWCDAPIRHTDHALPHHQGGATSEANGQGLCEQCNYHRQAPGWRAEPRHGPRHTLEITTPAGRRYTSTAPPPPGARPRLRLPHPTHVGRPHRGWRAPTIWHRRRHTDPVQRE